MIRVLMLVALAQAWPVSANAGNEIRYEISYQKETDPRVIASMKMDEGPILPPIGPLPGEPGIPGVDPGNPYIPPIYYPPTGNGFNLDSIVNLAREIWAVIQAGKPAANVTAMNANALPEGARSARDLGGWVKTPKVYLYNVKFKSLGREVGNFQFRIGYTHGGNVEGKGKYLTSVKIVPAEYKVPWGNSLDVKTEVSNIYSIDSRDNPTAVMEFMMTWTLSSNFKFTGGSKSFIVRGDGTFEDISDGTLR